MSKPQLRVTLGYPIVADPQPKDYPVLVEHLRTGRSGWFRPGARTITGLRDKFGECRAFTSAEVRRLLRVREDLQKPYDSEIVDDPGLFEEFTAADVHRMHSRAVSFVDVGPKMLMQLCGVFSAKKERA